jgi:hypothetical protein
MRRFSALLLALVFFATAALCTAADFPLERGVKGDVEDVILVGADDWHASIAATPLAIWSEGNSTVSRPLLILPKNVDAGGRMGWVEESDLERYGIASVLHTFESANITALTIHGKGDLAKAMVEAAQKEKIKAYVTATLELPRKSEPQTVKVTGIPEARSMFLEEADLQSQSFDYSEVDPQWLQAPDPDVGGNSSQLCPVNPEVRDYLYNQIETIIDDYKSDGVVLYKFGFQDEDYCFCDICKEQFYKDTGIDISKVHANSYNLERWNQWKQQQVMQIVNEARNITANLGPVKVGAALDNPFDRNQGYNFAEIANAVDFTIVSPVSAEDAHLIAGTSEKPVYIRLSDDYVGYVLSAQNVEGAVKYIEDLTRAGISGFAFEYNVVYTPLWAELQPPSAAAKWLLQQLGGKTLGIGNVSWKCDSRIMANNSFDLALKLSERWKSSPGAVIVGENYSASLMASTIASYLNWPVLFVNGTLPSETALALKRLNAKEVVLAGPVSDKVKGNLSEMNLTLQEGSGEFLMREMLGRNESPSMVVVTNSRDLSLLQPVPQTNIQRKLVGDLLVHVEMTPSGIPAEETGEIIRLNMTLTNKDVQEMKDIQLIDIFPRGRLIRWPKPSIGTVNVTDPYTGTASDVTSAFMNGSLLRWRLGSLDPGKSAGLTVEVEIMYPMDSGWKQLLDGGATAAYKGFSYNHTLENRDSWPIINITYPTWIYSGRANITWNIDRTASYMAVNLYSPDGMSGRFRIDEGSQDRLYELRAPLLTPGKWKFNIEAGDGFTHRTENYTIDVRSNTAPLNVTAFSHTKVPRLSLVAAEAAAAHKALLVDVAKDPQEIDPLEVEEDLKRKVDDLKVSPKYLMIVGDQGSLPFVSLGLKQKLDSIMEYDLYRDYQLNLDEDNYSEVATGRIMGLSVYDASQLLARTLAYDRLMGAWKNNALVISSTPLTFPQAPTAMSIRDYLIDAAMRVKDLRYEEATYQQVISQMNNGQNIVYFDNHGNQDAWALSDWSMMDSALDGAHVKDLVLSAQTTTTSACLTSSLKGFSLNVSGTRMYIPLKMEDSIALAFIRAGAVNYVGESALSWIFVSDDYCKRLFQALVFENATIGEAAMSADNLFKLKFKGAENTKKNLSEYDETLPNWDTSVQEMLNQTALMGMVIGDPSFRPALPNTPSLPYSLQLNSSNETAGNKTIVKASVIPLNESATDWLYWPQTETTEGKLRLNAPPVIIAEVSLPKDADKIVVKEDGLAVWHDEDLMGDHMRVLWPIIRPKLGEKRSFQVEYVQIPGELQVINVTAGWNAISIHLNPNDASASKYLKNQPYRGIFSVVGDAWDFSMKDDGVSNVTEFKPGEGYLIDSEGNFSIEIAGKPVDLPYRMMLHRGWNMIGLPINRSVSLKNITVNAEHKRYKYPQAAEMGAVSAFVWHYDGIGWTHLGENESLEPGEAYLVEAMSDVRLEFR